MTRDRMSRHMHNARLKKDAMLLLISIACAVVLTKSGVFERVLHESNNIELAGAFVAGLFFTSFFTTPLAIAAFLSLGTAMDPLLMGFLGGLGAVVGDLVLFAFIRHTFQEDVDYLVRTAAHKRIFAAVHRRTFRWLVPFAGALVIASPLPDELGVALMGVSHMRVTTLIAISYLMNSVSISVIGFLA
jgi:uncharacterized membrane protein YdjX (TVP38/TMEM64 family)